MKREVVAMLQIHSWENLAVHTKDWYLNLRICIRNLLDKSRSAEGKGTKTKKKGRERLWKRIKGKYQRNLEKACRGEKTF